MPSLEDVQAAVMATFDGVILAGQTVDDVGAKVGGGQGQGRNACSSGMLDVLLSSVGSRLAGNHFPA